MSPHCGRALQQLGWIEGHNLRLDLGFGALGSPDRRRAIRTVDWSWCRPHSSTSIGN
jgi:hypothetical protein